MSFFRLRSLSLLAISMHLVACTTQSENLLGAGGPKLSSDEVAIFRSEWGVPHIYAVKEEDGFYGLGYAMAEDQVERLLFAVHAARGEISANLKPGELPLHIVGPLPAEQMLEMDYQSRLWDVRKHAEAAVDKLDPQVRKNYARFIDGVNAYLVENPVKIPGWAPKSIEIADLVAMPLSSLWGAYNGGIGVNDCRRGGIQTITAARALATGPGDYSNQWAVTPERSSTGGAILLTDPHGGIDGRFTYEYVLHAGDFHSSGYALAPTLFLARNENIGWGLTTGSPDVADCYEIEMLSGAENSYLYDGEEKSFKIKEITIGVKDADPVRITAKYSDHNGVPSPVVAENNGKAYAVSTPYYNNIEGLHNLSRAMNMAGNVDEFLDAQRAGWMFPQNLLVADTSGDILYFRAGMTPVRPNVEVNWLAPVNGNSSEFAWRGVHSVDDLLIIKSPAAGYLQNNNVGPEFMDKKPPSEIEGMAPYLLTAGYTRGPNSRGQRAIDVLSATPAMSEEEAFDLAFDTVSVGWEKWISSLHGAIANGPDLSAQASAFADDLFAFDGRLSAGSSSALKYIYWRVAFRNILEQSDNDDLRAMIAEEHAPSTQLSLKLVGAVEDAAGQLSNSPEGLNTVYGDEFRIRGLGDNSWPISGGGVGVPFGTPAPPADCALGPVYFCPSTLLAMAYAPKEPDGKRYALAGSRIMRLDFYAPEGIRSYSAQNPGISDDPLSLHFDDQAQNLMSKSAMKPVYFYWPDLKPNIVSAKRLNVIADGE